MEEDNTDGKKKKTTPSIPANYISILQLQERWINEKEKKRKEEEEEEERRRKQQVEDDLKKAEEERLNRSNQKRSGKKKKSMNGGGAGFVEKENPEATVGVGSGGGEYTADMLSKEDRGFRRKRYDSKKKKKTNQDVALVDDVVVDCDGSCGSIAPPESVVTESVTPGNDVIRVCRKKGEKAATAIETQFEDLSIKRDETKNLKAQTKPTNRNRVKQGNDLAHIRFKMPIGAAASTMVWVKKERTNDGIASGVKP